MKHAFLLLTLFISGSLCCDADIQKSTPDQSKDTETTTGNIMDSATDENVKVSELQELIVTGERMWIENDRVVFIPSRKEKNLSNSVGSLIEAMNLPILKGESNTITTVTGDNVSIYINGSPVTESDLATFWPKDVKRIEYMENPMDQRYSGNSRIVNFIVREYSAGGVTKLLASQSYPWLGVYQGASKLVHDKWTYGLTLSGGFKRENLKHGNTQETFDNIFFNGILYDRIIKEEKIEGENYEDEWMSAVASATFRNESTYISHSATFAWDRNPGTMEHGRVGFSPEISDGDIHSNWHSSRSSSLKASGLLWFALPSRSSTQINWWYSYNHANTYSRYEESGFDPILNGTRGDNHVIGGAYNWSKQFGSKFYFQFNVNSSYYIYDTGYISSSLQKMRRSYTNPLLGLTWFPNNRVNLTAMPMMIIIVDKVNDFNSETSVTPGFRLDGFYSWNSRHRSSLSGLLMTQGQSQAQQNDAKVRLSELLWIVGNPDLRPETSLTLNLNHTWIINHSLWLYGAVGYLGKFNSTAYAFRHPGNEMDGLEKYYVQLDSDGSVSVSASAGWNITSNLYASGGVKYTHCYFNGPGVKSFNNVLPDVSIKWTLGNLVIGGHWLPAHSSYFNGGTSKIKFSDSYGINCSYGNGDFFAKLYLNHFLSKYSKWEEHIIGLDYSRMGTSWNKGFSIQLELSYIFSYGKRVDKSVNQEMIMYEAPDVLGR